MDMKPPITGPDPLAYPDNQMSEMEKKKLRKVAQDMEGEFLKILMKQMKKTLPGVAGVEKAPGKDIMIDFMIERYAESVAREEPLGIAKMIYDQYTKKGKTL